MHAIAPDKGMQLLATLLPNMLNYSDMGVQRLIKKIESVSISLHNRMEPPRDSYNMRTHGSYLSTKST